MTTLARLSADFGNGRLPSEPIIAGVTILLAGAMLITHGLRTDLCDSCCWFRPVGGS